MEADERLIVREGSPPATADGKSLGCVMLVSTNHDTDIKWFDFKMTYLPPAPVTRIEWDIDTMDVVLPVEVANWLIKNGYARLMTASEARTYNNRLEKDVKLKETAT